MSSIQIISDFTVRSPDGRLGRVWRRYMAWQCQWAMQTLVSKLAAHGFDDARANEPALRNELRHALRNAADHDA